VAGARIAVKINKRPSAKAIMLLSSSLYIPLPLMLDPKPFPYQTQINTQLQLQLQLLLKLKLHRGGRQLLTILACPVANERQ